MGKCKENMMKIKDDKKVISTDWRITDQEIYLFGATFEKKEFKPKSKEWDHDHCEFCWAEFNEDSEMGFTEGYYTENRESWVCNKCYQDFKVLFDFKLK